MNTRYRPTFPNGMASFKLLWSIAFLAIAGCMVRLAPDFDPSIVEGLTATNVQMMELFASVSAGTTPATIADRMATYNQIIGRLDALRIEASARTIPRPLIPVLKSSAENELAVADSDTPQAPSVGSIQQMVKTITKMRDTDKQQGLTALEVVAFKQQIEISMDQALIYEKALQR
ncbi:MAG: hypothetical protein U1F76_18040 [Candidatus Competibacteraceae bacterium]